MDARNARCKCPWHRFINWINKGDCLDCGTPYNGDFEHSAWGDGCRWRVK